MECYFPVDKIARGSRIAIWGGGELGRQLIEWNNKFNYCEIVCVFDRNENIMIPGKIQVSKIENWKSFNFEKIIVTITRNIEELKKECSGAGILIENCIFLAEEKYISLTRAPKARVPKASYAQEGEDIILCNLMRRLGRKNISFCDIGANDPYHFSNTYLLEQSFDISRGVLIEPNPVLYERLGNERKNCICVNCGVTDSRDGGCMEFYVMQPDTLSSFSGETIQEYQKRGYKLAGKEKIPCRNINDIFDEYFGKDIDIVSIDTEGFDLRLVRAIDFEKHRPVAMCIETCGFCTGKNQDGMDIISFLLQKGYIVYADTFLNTIFVDRNVMLEEYSRDMNTICPFAG